MNLSKFSNQLISGDYARTNLFHIQLGHIKGQDQFYHKEGRDYNKDDMKFMVKQVTLPGKSLGTIDTKRFGAIFKVANDVIVDTCTMTVICSSDMRERLFFEGWIDYIYNMNAYQGLTTDFADMDGDPNTIDWNGADIKGNKKLVYRMAYYDDYISKLSVDTLDRSGKQAYHVDMLEAFPTNIGPVELSWGEGGEVATFNVTFSYRDWFANMQSQDEWSDEFADKLIEDAELEQLMMEGLWDQREMEEEVITRAARAEIEEMKRLAIEDAERRAKEAADSAYLDHLMNDIEYIEDYKNSSENREMMDFINGTDTDMQPFINEGGATMMLDMNDEATIKLFLAQGYIFNQKHANYINNKNDQIRTQEEIDRERKDLEYIKTGLDINKELDINSLIPKFEDTKFTWKTGADSLPESDKEVTATATSKVEVITADGNVVSTTTKVAVVENTTEKVDDKYVAPRMDETKRPNYVKPPLGYEDVERTMIGKETSSTEFNGDVVGTMATGKEFENHDFDPTDTKVNVPAFETIKNNPNATPEMMENAEVDQSFMEASFDQDGMEAGWHNEESQRMAEGFIEADKIAADDKAWEENARQDIEMGNIDDQFGRLDGEYYLKEVETARNAEIDAEDKAFESDGRQEFEIDEAARVKAGRDYAAGLEMPHMIDGSNALLRPPVAGPKEETPQETATREYDAWQADMKGQGQVLDSQGSYQSSTTDDTYFGVPGERGGPMGGLMDSDEAAEMSTDASAARQELEFINIRNKAIDSEQDIIYGGQNMTENMMMMDIDNDALNDADMFEIRDDYFAGRKTELEGIIAGKENYQDLDSASTIQNNMEIQSDTDSHLDRLNDDAQRMSSELNIENAAAASNAMQDEVNRAHANQITPEVESNMFEDDFSTSGQDNKNFRLAGDVLDNSVNSLEWELGAAVDRNTNFLTKGFVQAGVNREMGQFQIIDGITTEMVDASKNRMVGKMQGRISQGEQEYLISHIDQLSTDAGNYQDAKWTAQQGGDNLDAASHTQSMMEQNYNMNYEIPTYKATRIKN